MRWGIAAAIPEDLYFYDIDTHEVDTKTMLTICSDALLLYKTNRGYHAFFKTKHLTELKPYLDTNCPCDAVRVYPDDDFEYRLHANQFNEFISWLTWIHGWSPITDSYMLYYGFNPEDFKPKMWTYVKPKIDLKRLVRGVD